MKRTAAPCNADPSNLFAFETWLEGRNLTRTTGYRYRRQGLIHTVNIFGRLYVTRDEIETFERRAVAGEFEREAKTPRRPASAQNDADPGMKPFKTSTKAGKQTSSQPTQKNTSIQH